MLLRSPWSPGSSWPIHALRANFEVDLTGSKLLGISFAPSWREKHIGAKIIDLSRLEKVIHEKLFCLKNEFFFQLWWPKLFTLAKICWHITERAFQKLSNAFFRFFLAIIVTDLARKNRRTVPFCQNGQHFGNWTLFDHEGVTHGPNFFARKSSNVAIDTL